MDDLLSELEGDIARLNDEEDEDQSRGPVWTPEADTGVWTPGLEEFETAKKSKEEIEAEINDLLPATPEPEVEPESEIKPEPPAGELTSGTLVLKYTRSVVKRDEFGRIVEIIGDGSHKYVRRDDEGRVVEIVEETETELNG